jgi:hypothetical protein
MKTFYEASNAVEAHMLLDLLKQEGLSANIRGEHLQGALGEIPAGGLVRLEIDEANYAQARALVERWDASQPSEPVSKPVSRRPLGFYGFLLGMALGAGACYAFYRVPSTINGIDHNGDGVIDEKWTYSPSGVTLTYEADRNLDRKVDFMARFDRRGVMESSESDDNFDGVFETRTRYRYSNAVMSDVDTDGDGFPDLRLYFTNGVVSSNMFMQPSTGLPLRVEYYKLGKMTSAEVDTDKDGTLDTRYIYNSLGEVASTEKIVK